MDKKPRIFTMSFASVYPLYVQKAEKKGRTKDEVDEIITWLTGYSGEQLQRAIDAKVDFETFFAQAPRMNPNVGLITGVVCGVRVEDVADPLMQKIRYLDKLIDELAKGKKMASILRELLHGPPGLAASGRVGTWRLTQVDDLTLSANRAGATPTSQATDTKRRFAGRLEAVAPD